jgi:hypothetical protein
VAGIKNLHQEINKHLTLSVSVNQVVRYWLLPLFMETSEYGDPGMICNIACPAVASKVLRALITAKLLTEMQVFYDWHFIKHDIHHTLPSESECIKHMDIVAHPKVNIV